MKIFSRNFSQNFSQHQNGEKRATEQSEHGDSVSPPSIHLTEQVLEITFTNLEIRGFQVLRDEIGSNLRKKWKHASKIAFGEVEQDYFESGVQFVSGDQCATISSF